jgi:hypothetical protein
MPSAGGTSRSCTRPAGTGWRVRTGLDTRIWPAAVARAARVNLDRAARLERLLATVTKEP